MTASRQQGLANALAQKTNTPRMCAATVRGWFGLAALGDFDGDGAADAEDMWKAAKLRHPGDRNPPDGVPVYYGGGSKDNGHIGVAYRGQLRGTDGGGSGIMGTTPLSMPETAWGMPYLGWSEDLYGNVIPDEVAELRAEIARLQDKLARKIARRAAVREERATLEARVVRKTATVDRLTAEIADTRTALKAKKAQLP